MCAAVRGQQDSGVHDIVERWEMPGEPPHVDVKCISSNFKSDQL